MQENEYPALFVAADAASNEAQNALLLAYKSNSILLVLAAIMALISVETTWAAIISALLFMASLGVYTYGHQKNFQAHWYQARALAESVKTATWRLMMAAEPFSKQGEDANLEKFRALLTELLLENRGIGPLLASDSGAQQQITRKMLNVMRQTFEEKRTVYLDERIDEQQKWYTRKSTFNRCSSKRYFKYLCAAYAIAVVFLLVRIAAPKTPYLPIEIFAVIASSIVGWTQIKRFEDLASTYAFTAQEVSIIKSRYQSVENSQHLARFVRDAENAFSKEHTQWAARRDY